MNTKTTTYRIEELHSAINKIEMLLIREKRTSEKITNIRQHLQAAIDELRIAEEIYMDLITQEISVID